MTKILYVRGKFDPNYLLSKTQLTDEAWVKTKQKGRRLDGSSSGSMTSVPHINIACTLVLPNSY